MAPYFIVMMVYLCDAGAALSAVLWRIVLITGAIMPLYFLQRTLALDACCANGSGGAADITAAAAPAPAPKAAEAPATAALQRRASSEATASAVCEALGKPRYLRWLLGVGGTWMLYDITQYGLKIFGPVLCENIFGESESIVAVCWQNIVLSHVIYLHYINLSIFRSS